MKPIYFLLLTLCISSTVFSQPVNIFSTGAAGSYITGNSSATIRTDGGIISTTAAGGPGPRRGYAVFNLSTLPATAVITSVTVNFNVATYGGMGTPSAWATYGYAGDLSTVTTAAALYPDMVAGTLLSNATYGTATGAQTLASTAASVAFVQAQIGNKISICWTGGGNRTYTITGETGAAATTGTFAPYLTINYTLCNAPTSVTATATPNPLCQGTTLNLNGTATGATNYSWAGPAGYTSTTLSGTLVAGATAAGVYTLTATNNCGPVSNSAKITTAAVTVNPLPAAPGGTETLCTSGTTSLTEPPGSATWSSSNTGVATVGSGTGVVTGVVSGTSTIIYTLSTGCQATAAVTVNPVPLDITGTSIMCAGATTTANDAVGPGIWSSGATTIATVSSETGVVIGVAGGTATISYTLTSGCGIVTTVVTVNPPPAPILGTTTICAFSTTTLSDAVGPGAWSSGATTVATVNPSTGVVTGAAGGDANITYTLTSGCGITIAPVTVYASISAISGVTTICGTTTTALSDATSSGIWSSSTTTVAIVNPASGLVIGVAPGTTTISYTLSGGCGLVSAIVTVNPLPAAIPGATSLCAFATTSLSDAVGPGTWSSSATTVATVDPASGMVTGAGPGTATITYTLTSGCGTATALVTVNPSATAISGATGICGSATTTLSDGAGPGTWSSSIATVATVNLSTGIVKGVAPGTTTILYSLTSGCGDVITVVTVSPLVAPISGATTVCADAATVLSDAVGPGGWSSSSSTIAYVSSTGTVTGLSAGTEDITYTLSSGCGMATTSVSVNPIPVPIAGITTICGINTSMLNDAIEPGTWSSSAATVVTAGPAGLVTAAAPGTATITYTLSSGCGSVTTVVTVNPAMPAITGPGNICGTSSAILSDAYAGGTWNSSTPSVATIDLSTGAITGMIPGTTTITYDIPATSGCITTTAETVTVIPAAFPGNSGPVCLGSTVELVSGSAGASSWYWTGPDGFSSTLETPIFAPPGTATYSLTVGSGLCSDSGAVFTTTVVVNPNAPIEGIDSVCQGLSTFLTNIVGGGVWSTAAWTIATVQADSGRVTGLLPGTATIVYSLPTGCMDQVTFNVIAFPTAITGVTQACPGTSTALSNSTAGGVWASRNGGIATVNAFTGAVTGVYADTVGITYTILPGCSVTAIVTVNPSPAPITNSSVIMCPGTNDSLHDLSAGGAWTCTTPSIATVIDTSGVVSAVAGGRAEITYTLPTGCFVSKSISVNAIPVPVVSYSPYTNTFYTPAIWISYQWYDSIAGIIPGATSPSVAALYNEYYYVVVTDSNGCTGVSAPIWYNTNELGISNATGNAEVTIYPNPASEILNIVSFEKLNAVISGIDGKTEAEITGAKEIDISTINNGMHLISLYNEAGLLIAVRKFVKLQ